MRIGKLDFILKAEDITYMNIGKYVRQKKFINYLNDYVRVYKVIPTKRTARCPRQLILEDVHYNKYLLVSGKTNIEKFYIRRAIEFQQKYQECLMKAGYDLNFPLDVWEEDGKLFALYHYFEFFFPCRGEKPQKYIHKFVEENEIEIEVDEYALKKIEDNFLKIFPEEYRERIKELEEYKDYFREILSLPRLKVCFEHGDYATNNILVTNQGHFFLMDFEFSAEYQPIGYDLYTYNRTVGIQDESIMYYALSQKRENLKDKVNSMLDKEHGSKKPYGN